MIPADAWEGAETVLDESACPICFRESCDGHDERDAPPEMQAQAATATSDAEPDPGFVTADAVMATPRPRDIVEGLAWAEQLSVIVSESGAGKTFWLLCVSASVSDGTLLHGRTVQQGSVAYLSFEGDALGLRLRALRDVAGHRLEHLYIWRASAPLSPIVDRDRVELPSAGERVAAQQLDTLRDTLAAEGRPPIVLIIIDTVRASHSGSEDGSESVSAYLRAVRRLMARVPGSAAILAHHAGWQDGEAPRKRERGSSAWRGNADAVAYLEATAFDTERHEARLVLQTLKVRDAERPPPLHLIRRRVELPEAAGDDLQHGPATSCLIDRDRRSREEREAEQAAQLAAEHHALDLQVLRRISESPELATSQDRIRLAVGGTREHIYAAIARLVDRGWLRSPDRQRQPYTVTDAGQTALREPRS